MPHARRQELILPEPFKKGADIIGDKIMMEREIQTIMSQKRFEGRIVAASPLGITAVIKIVSPEYLEPLFMTQTGKIVATLSLLDGGWLYADRKGEFH